MTLLSQCAVVTEKTIGGITTFKQQLQQEIEQFMDRKFKRKEKVEETWKRCRFHVRYCSVFCHTEVL